MRALRHVRYIRRLQAFVVLMMGMAISGSSTGQDGPAPIVQRWGIRDTSSHSPVAFHPMTERLLTKHEGGALLWDTGSGQAIRSFEVDGKDRPHITAMSFSPDGRRLLIGGSTSLRLHDSRRGDVMVEFDLAGRIVRDADLSPDGRLVAAACENPSAVVLWDSRSGRQLHVLNEHRYSAIHVRFSPDSKRLLSGGNDALAVLWDVETGELIRRFPCPTEVRGSAFNADGKRLLTFGSGEFWHSIRAIVWDIDSGQPQQVIARPFYKAWFVDDDVQLLQANGDRQRWRSDRHELAPQPSAFPTPTYDPKHRLAVSKDHWTLRVQEREPIAELRSPSGESIPLPLPRFDAANQVPLALSADGRWLVTGGDNAADNKSIVWDLREGRKLHALIPSTVAQFHPDGTRVALAKHGTMTLFDLQSGESVQSYQVDKGAIESLQFVAGGKQILTASGAWYDGDRGQLLLWDTETGQQLRNFAPTDKAVVHAQMTPDETAIVASFTPGDDGAAGVDQISVFDATNGELLRELTLPTKDFGAGLLDPTGQRVISGQFRNEIKVWELETLEHQRSFPLKPAAISADGAVLSTYDKLGSLNFWNIDTGNFLGSQVMPVGQPQKSLFHPGGIFYLGSTGPRGVSGALSGRSIGFWNLRTGKLKVELFTFDNGREWLIGTADGHWSGSEGGLGRIAWRREGTDTVTTDLSLTQLHNQPRRIAEALSLSLPDGVSLLQSLANLPATAPQEPDPPTVTRYVDYERSRRKRQEAVKALEDAGGDVQADIHGTVKSIHLEKRRITSALARQFPWVRSAERLYLAKTGITNEQLQWVGMMGNVKRLSLWGNAITDEGLAQLATLWSLEVMDVHDTAVTAAGLNHLWLLENLRTLIVPDSVALDQLDRLRRLPNLEIIRRAAGD